MILLNHKINEKTPLYGNSGVLEINRIRQIKNGDSSNNSELIIPSHVGTHIDAPFHFDRKGKKLDEYSADFWVCQRPCLLQKYAENGEIFLLKDWLPLLESIPPETDLLLIKSGFERFREKVDLETESSYIFHGPGISPEIGLWLRENRRIKMLGFDFISLTSFEHRELGKHAHQSFLSMTSETFPGEPILVIEDMKLSVIDQAPRKVIVSPLLYENADGAPVTVFAVY